VPERKNQSGEPQRSAIGPGIGLGPIAVAGMLLLVLIAPLVVHGQAGPFRDQSPANTPPPAATADPRSSDAPWLVPDEARADLLQASARRAATHPVPARRPRPDAAPVVLMPTAAPTPTPDVPPARASARTQPERRPAVTRSWPLAPGSFELSQRFGCVPQLLGYYPTVPGCPPGAQSYHNGLDLAATQGTPIYAAASGWVTVAGRDRPDAIANTRIVIQHDGANEGYTTEYYHWIKTYVEPGDYVRAGDLIAEVGSVGYSTGPHLHFTVVETGNNQAIDPTRWLPTTSSGTTIAGATVEQERVSTGGGRIVVQDYIPPTPTPTPSRR
jgi:murein DD-endopeptidase MepM/ murein hydrolase activator NlpD